MSVPAEKGKSGALRKGGLVFMGSETETVCVRTRGNCLLEAVRVFGYSIGSVKQHWGLGKFTVSE